MKLNIHVLLVGLFFPNVPAYLTTFFTFHKSPEVISNLWSLTGSSTFTMRSLDGASIQN